MRRRRAILIAEDPDKTEKHRESRITLPIRRKKSAMNRKHKIKCVAAQKNATKKCNECAFDVFRRFFRIEPDLSDLENKIRKTRHALKTPQELVAREEKLWNVHFHL